MPRKSNALKLLLDNNIPVSSVSRRLMDLITMSDADGVIQYVSPHNERVSGWRLEDEIGNSIFEHVHPDDVERVRQVYFTSLQNRCSERIEYRYQQSDGNYVYLETVGSLLCRGRKVLGAILCSREMYDRLLPNTFSPDSSDMYIKAFRFNPDPVAISTLAEGRYVDVNEAFCRHTGYKREEAIGRTSEELGIWALPAERRQIIDSICAQGPLSDVETSFATRTGEIKIALLSIGIIQVGGQAHLLSIIKDITERSNLEQAVRLLEERFYKAFNASPIMMCISTLEEGICVDINDSFCRMTGFSRDQVLGKNLPEMSIWEIPVDRSIVSDALNEGQSISEYEVNYRTVSGAIRSCLYSAERIDVNGQACILSIMVDITERKQMEREMARLDQLNLVGQMAVNMGHEIRNPMTTVRGYLQLLRGQKKYSEDQEALDLMIEEIDRSNAIISVFISLAHDKYIQLRPMDLNMVVTGLLPLLQSSADSQGKYIKVDIEAIPRLLLDENEIGQLIINLAQNGLEAMPPGGTLHISTSIQGSEVVLAIQDEGSGISDEILEKLGTPFFTTKPDRTGLGLALCFRIAHRHQAVIQYKSNPTGTVVEVAFPTKPH